MLAVIRASIGRTCVTFLHTDSNTLPTAEIGRIEFRDVGAHISAFDLDIRESQHPELPYYSMITAHG